MPPFPAKFQRQIDCGWIFFRMQDAFWMRLDFSQIAGICSQLNTSCRQYAVGSTRGHIYNGGSKIIYGYISEFSYLFLYCIYTYIFICMKAARGPQPYLFSQFGLPSEAGVGHCSISPSILDFRVLAALVCSFCLPIFTAFHGDPVFCFFVLLCLFGAWLVWACPCHLGTSHPTDNTKPPKDYTKTSNIRQNSKILDKHPKY